MYYDVFLHGGLESQVDRSSALSVQALIDETLWLLTHSDQKQPRRQLLSHTHTHTHTHTHAHTHAPAHVNTAENEHNTHANMKWHVCTYTQTKNCQHTHIGYIPNFLLKGRSTPPWYLLSLPR